MRTWMLWWRSLMLLALGAGLPLVACSVPVFRYALERWPADFYPLEVAHTDPTVAAAWVARIEEASVGEGRYLNVQPVAVTSGSGLPSSEDPPELRLSYPEIYRLDEVLWRAPASEASLAALAESPLRREIARRILSGDSVVWLLLRSGDAAADAAARETLAAELRRLEDELPKPDITAEDRDVHMDSELELAIRFSILEVERDDPAEAVLLASLLGGFAIEDVETGPTAIPLYGRGRSLPSLATGPVGAEAVEEVSWYLTGACSCEIKR